jgi:hypothetical protein
MVLKYRYVCKSENDFILSTRLLCLEGRNNNKNYMLEMKLVIYSIAYIKLGQHA